MRSHLRFIALPSPSACAPLVAPRSFSRREALGSSTADQHPLGNDENSVSVSRNLTWPAEMRHQTRGLNRAASMARRSFP